MRRLILFGVLVTVCLMTPACTNPFAPALNDSIGNANFPLGDQHSVNGFFEKFSYAYAYRDTLIYGQLLSDSFTFVFPDYDINADVSWGRDVDMHTTLGLFQNSQSLDLVWDEIISQTGDSLQLEVTRAFNMTITFNPEDIEFVNGNAVVTLSRASPDSVWQMSYWYDNSNY